MTPETQAARFHCGRCRMGFRVGLPLQAGKMGAKGASWTRCSEPGCGQRFWHGIGSRKFAGVVCGIAPKDLPERAYG